jgi:hypothetical protein
MALDLLEVNTKVDVRVHAYLKAKGKVRGVDMAVVAREMLHEAVRAEYEVFSIANQSLKSKDMPEIDGEWK